MNPVGDGVRHRPAGSCPAGRVATVHQWCEKADGPGYDAAGPRRSSMRSSWLYLAVRSPRAGAPVLICPAPVATARSAMKVSSVSPERCEMMLR